MANWFDKVTKFTKDAGEVIGSVGGLLGGAAVGAIEAGINKLDGMDNDDIMKQWEKTADAGQEVGAGIGGAVGEVVPYVAGAVIGAKVVEKSIKGANKGTKKIITRKAWDPEEQRHKYIGEETGHIQKPTKYPGQKTGHLKP